MEARMGIELSGNWDDLTNAVTKQLRDAAEEGLADELVDAVRQRGLESADQIDLQIDADGRSIGIDAARVIRLANQKLGL